MQTCKDCGRDYNEFTSGTPSSENRCDFCDEDWREWQQSEQNEDGTWYRDGKEKKDT